MTHLSPALSLLPLSLLIACGDKGDDTAGSGSGDSGQDDCTELTFFLDADGDGYGGDEAVSACEAPEGYVAQSTDCDDQDPDAHPDGSEVCDGADNDCDGDVDEDASDATTFYVDSDGDGFGDDASTVIACELGDGLAEVGGDCDDTEAAAFPGATEVCDGVDNDCDGETDGASYPSDFAGSLSEAVAETDAALLCIEPGTYPEQLVMDGRGLTVRGYGADQTVITGLGDGEPAVSLGSANGARVGGLAAPSLAVTDSKGVALDELVLGGEADWGSGSCEGCVLSIHGSAATLTQVDVRDTVLDITNANSRLNGLAMIYQSEVSWLGGAIADNVVETSAISSANGMALYAYDSVVDLDGVEITGNRYSLNREASNASVIASLWGLVSLYQADTTLSDVALDDNEAVITTTQTGAGGNAYSNLLLGLSLNGGSFEWTGGSMSRNEGTATADYQATAGLLQASDVDVDITDVDIDENLIAGRSPDYGYANLLSVQNQPYHYTRVQLRANRVEASGIGGWVQGLVGGYEADGSTLTNVVIAGNTLAADDYIYVMGLVSAYYYDVAADHVTVLSNQLSAYAADSGVFYVYNGGLSVTDSVVADNALLADTSGLVGAGVISWDGRGTVDLTYSDVFDNSSNQGDDFMQGSVSTFDALAGTGNIVEAPQFASTSGAATEWDLSPDSGSPLVDAGNPDVTDVDGSRSDMGATGGPEGGW